ncbi:unnamed protein product [Boreogadus saida]
MKISTFGAIQTVKYTLQSREKTAVELFKRKDVSAFGRRGSAAWRSAPLSGGRGGPGRRQARCGACRRLLVASVTGSGAEDDVHRPFLCQLLLFQLHLLSQLFLSLLSLLVHPLPLLSLLLLVPVHCWRRN